MSENLHDGQMLSSSLIDLELGLLIPFSELVRRHGIRVDRVIHAGAHLGEERADYASLGTKDVLWIEGNPDLLERLRANIAPYGHTVVQALLGAEAGREVTFNVSNFESMSSSVLELGTHRQAHPQVEYVGRQTHRLQTLDNVAEAHGFARADFLNLDLQGYELECLKGGVRVLEHVRTVYSEVNVDYLYSEGALLPELDAWLNEHGFEAKQVQLYGSPHRGSPEFVGWGDCCFVRVDNPRPFHRVFPKEAAAWFARPPGIVVTGLAQVEDSLRADITLDFGSSWQGRLALALTRTELARRLPSAEIAEVTGDSGGTDLLVLDGGTDVFANSVVKSAAAPYGSVAWQGVHIPATSSDDLWVGKVSVWPAIVSLADAETGRRLRRIAPDLGTAEIPDIGLLTSRLLRDRATERRGGAAAQRQPSGLALSDADVRDDVAAALSPDLGLTVVAVESTGIDELLGAVETADVVISGDPRLLAVAFSLGRPMVPLECGADGRLHVTFGSGVGTSVKVMDLMNEPGSRKTDRALLPALQAELDAYFDSVATLAAESAWRRRRGGEIANLGGARMSDADARAFMEELNAHGGMARRIVEERHLVIVRDRELAAQRDSVAQLHAQLKAQLEATRSELAALRQTRTFRYTARLRDAYARALTAIGRR